MKTIHEVAALAGVASSTLRYYDEIGLVTPQARSEAGYRLYGREELLRVREIVIWRELGFSLAQIARLLDDPRDDRVTALGRQLELAAAQAERLQRITVGLEQAMMTVSDGRSLSEEEIFAGLSDRLDAPGDGSPDAREGVARSVHGRDTQAKRPGRQGGVELPDDDGLPERICVTCPIRLGEALLALGILPVGAGTYEDRFTQKPGVWPWPPLVESAVRSRIRGVANYGGDVPGIGALRPDLILDLALRLSETNLAHHASGGRFDLDSLTSIAPTRVIKAEVGSMPAFTARLAQVADVLGCPSEAESLLAIWAARTSVLRAHLAGIEVSALWCRSDQASGSSPSGSPQVLLCSPTAMHPAQVLTSVGLAITPMCGHESWNGYVVGFEEDAIPDLDAPTLFLHTRSLRRDQVNRFVSEKLSKHISAVRTGRVFDVGEEFSNSGWFGAHWQLQLIARAYGLVLLRAGHDLDAVYAAVNPTSGLVSIATPRSVEALVLRGPYMSEQSLVSDGERALTLELDAVSATHMAQCPEMYTWTRGDGADTPFVTDRESALERIAARSARQASSSRTQRHDARRQRLWARPLTFAH